MTAGLHAGVTGQRTSMESRVEGLIDQLHSITDKAVAVGFGVSGPEQVTQSYLLPLLCMLAGRLCTRQDQRRPTSCMSVLCSLQARQIMQWGAEGVIVGSALVKALGDAATPEEGLQAMEKLAKSIRDAI